MSDPQSAPEVSVRTEPVAHFTHKFVVASLAMRNIMDMVERVAQIPLVSVLLLGETGTGKGEVAKEVHRTTAVRNTPYNGPFVHVNIPALQPSLLESELFGHERGSFTGATDRRVGLIKRAEWGTLFLDEIGEMPFEMQSRLNVFLDNHHVRPLGSDDSTRVETRIVAASNRNLRQMVQQGKFHQDLFYRLARVSFTIPPLRQRREEIPLLAAAFIRKFNIEHQTTIAEELSEEMVQFLRSHYWSGNIRELQSAVERAAIFSDRAALKVNDFELEQSTHEQSMIVGGNHTIDAIEREHVRLVLRRSQTQKDAAIILGVSQRVMSYKMEAMDIDSAEVGADLKP